MAKSAELKFLDKIIEQNYTNPISDAWVTLLTVNSMAAGDTASTRKGRLITNEKIHLRLSIDNTIKDGGIDDTENFGRNIPRPGPIRFVLIYDRNTDETLPIASEVWSNTVFFPANINSLRNLDNPSRFTVLWDEVFDLGCSQGYNSSDYSYPSFPAPIDITYLYNPYFGAANQVVHVHRSIEIKGCLDTTYSGPGGAVSSIQTGGIYLMACGYWRTDNPGDPIPGPTIYGTCRLRFYDQ